MSVNQLSPVADHEIGNPIFASKRQPASEQESIDLRLKRLKEEVLPFYPFLLTVPTDVPFRLGSRFVNNWAVGADGPFAPEEQQLQYMTFLTHHEGDSLLLAVGDWSDETGNAMADQHLGAQSAASTPVGGFSKKKISLSDYKNKKKGDFLASSFSEIANRKVSVSQGSGDNRPVSRDSLMENSAQDQPKPSSSSKKAIPSVAESIGQKHAPESELGQLQPREARKSEIRSPKRLRLSPERAGSRDPDHPQHIPNGVPALLSPTLPPTSFSLGLPRLLSPTLPPDIEKELARLREESPVRSPWHKRGVSNTLTARKDDRAKIKLSSYGRSQPVTSLNHGSQGLRSKPLNLAGKVLGLNSGDHHSFERSASEMHSDTIDKHVRPHASNTTNIYTSSVNAKKFHNVNAANARRIVKLKYGRPNRKRVEALLRFSGKRKMVLEGSPVKGSILQNDHQNKEEERSQKNQGLDHLSLVSSVPEKRTRNDETGSLDRERLKGPKKIASAESNTPILLPPSMSTQNQERKVSVTPVKDNSKTMHRVEPTDDGKTTPSSRQASKHTPDDSEVATKLSPQSETQENRERNRERRAWRDEFQKYGNLGRELKHAAERYTAKDNVTAADEKLAAVTAIEAILCFILAFVADDRSKNLARQVGESSTWLSILAYWRVVKKNSAPYRQLHSLCLILGAVSYDAIHALDIERLAVTPLPGDSAPGSDVNVMNDNIKRSRKEFLELKARLPECFKEARRLWIEGTRGLSEDILLREFPITWSNRCTNYSEYGNQQLKVGEYSGEYFLPLRRTTTPVEVVRFCWSALNEWCAKECVAWDGRLGL